MVLSENSARTRARTCFGDAMRFAGIDQCRAHRLDQRRDVVGRNEMHGLGPENLRHAADLGGDDRHAGGRGLEHHIGQRFRARGNDQHPPHGERLPRRTKADETNLFGEAEARGLGLQLGVVGAFADDGRGDRSGRSF